jgi:hypothetical protein
MQQAEQLARLVAFYEHLSVENLAQLRRRVCAACPFQDPFNEVEGHAAILAIFEHMFVQVDAPRFIVLDSMGQGEQAFLTWEFRFRMKRWVTGEQCIRGATHVRFDAGDGCYRTAITGMWPRNVRKLPLLGSFMRMLKRVGRR